MYWISMTGNIKTTPIANAPTGFPRDKKKHPKKFQGPSHSRDSNNMPLVFLVVDLWFGGYFDQALKIPQKIGDINLHFPNPTELDDFRNPRK